MFLRVQGGGRAEAPPCYETATKTCRKADKSSLLLTIYAGQQGKLRIRAGRIVSTPRYTPDASQGAASWPRIVSLKPSHPTRRPNPGDFWAYLAKPQGGLEVVGWHWCSLSRCHDRGNLYRPGSPPSTTAREMVRRPGRPASMVLAGIATPGQRTLGGNPRAACQHMPLLGSESEQSPHVVGKRAVDI
ncbi:hypothetical protein CCUG60885_03095 [Mycobacteroides salmoniphilum]|uniref:Uncharacterized protein n=1 Tax=Mycobacteroides salmoniphilum TaxID=404941 RepID=A0A4R8SDF4_9MYCO|nr:hypothetical protein CCUG60885_03095 [Mycobacteroides salmoniphilum]TEA09275.1 hypothetical protein CCUG60883_00036 [Mycobacteroides salmoniphilum]